MQHRVIAFDGLRGVAIGLVVLNHLQQTGGARVGSDIFFVLSGYLITKSLIYRSAGEPFEAYLFFIKRRLLRLVPPVMVIILATVVLFTLYPSLNGDIGKDILAAVTFSMNWQRAFAETNGGILGHLWTISAEQQFYCIWPLVFLLLPKGYVRPVLLGVLSACICWRFLLCVQGADVDRVSFGLDTHADGLIIGCLIALTEMSTRVTRVLVKSGPWAMLGALLIGLKLQAVSALALSFTTIAVNMLAACIVIAASQEGLVCRILSLRPFRLVGTISFSLYLWHYPVILLFHPAWAHWFHGIKVAQVGLSICLATAAYFLIERPAIIWAGGSRRSISRLLPQDLTSQPVPLRGGEGEAGVAQEDAPCFGHLIPAYGVEAQTVGTAIISIGSDQRGFI